MSRSGSVPGSGLATKAPAFLARWRLVCCLLTLVPSLSAAVFLEVPRAEPQLRVLPGEAEPAQPAPPLAVRARWDEHAGDYQSLIVIEPGQARRQRAWVVTFRHEDDAPQVAHAGWAFIDARGNIHIDCRGAETTGPLHDQWSPDSFAIDTDQAVWVIDDLQRGNRGRMLFDPWRPDDKRYVKALLLARYMTTGML